jgi:hypothetical protein
MVPAATSVHHFVRASSRTRTRHRGTRTRTRNDLIGPQVTSNLFDQRSASPQFEQPSSTSTVSLSTVRRGGLSTSTTKSGARHEPDAYRRARPAEA